MTDEGQTPEERGEKKAQAAGGGSQKKAKKDYDGDGKVETGSQEYLGSRDKAIKKAMKKRSVTTEDTDQLDEINAGYSTDSGGTSQNTIKTVVSDTTKQGKPRTKAQMMAAKRIASGKTIADVKSANTQSMRDRARARHAAFKARRMAKEELSDWREDLKEIMGEVEKTEGKKSKSKKVKNGICINPDTDDEKNKYEEVNAQKVAENLGAELQSLKIEDADGNVAYEVIDLVKPDPIKEKVELTYKSGQGFEAKLGAISARNTAKNFKTVKTAVSNIKSDGLVGGIKKTINNNNTTSNDSPEKKVGDAIMAYKKNLNNSYEMETEDLQQTVTNVLDKGSNFMKNTKVGRVLGKVFGPSKPSNKGSDYTKDGKVAR